MASDLVVLLFKATAAVSAGLLIILALRGPATRWLGAQGAYALWLMAPLLLTVALLPGPVRVAEAGIPHPALVAISTVTDMAGSKAVAAATPAWSPSPADLALPLGFVWGIGVVVSLATAFRRQRAFEAALGALTPCESEGVAVHRAAHPDIGPAMIGFLRPRIVVPANFAELYAPDERRLVLAHEQVHLHRGDPLANLMALLVRSAFWFNPLVHWSEARFRMDQELACDAVVLGRAPSDRRRYAEALLKAQFGTGWLVGTCSWPTRDASLLKARVASLTRVQPSTRRRRMGLVVVALVASCGGYAAWAAQPARTVIAPRHLIGPKTSLLRAVSRGDLAQARAVIQGGANLNLVERGEGTPLIVAARAGDLAMVRLLVESGAAIDQSAPGDANPLIASSRQGRLETVRYLIGKGADVNKVVPLDETALINAASAGKLEVVEELLAHGADPNLAVMVEEQGRRPFQRSPLSEAGRHGHADIVQLLRAHGAIA
ncbi:MAG: hypothetical protein BGN86_03950 [Caulobacterales bacterium 68-7]|nr:ankyrin repeat domain-containing protein [Caulobacterales bacterium]OJU08777.1 MAG: hypothetical protein BGN86_03950 [Caulobacterales bacterium 68-7]